MKNWFRIALLMSITFSGSVVATQDARALPSCASTGIDREAGVIAVQTAPSRSIWWGVNMHDSWNKFGTWYAVVYVNGRKYDEKLRPYEPHGSISPKAYKPGDQILVITAMVSPVYRGLGHLGCIGL